MRKNERLKERIDNDMLCKLLTQYYGHTYHWGHCYFPRGNDFSMPYKPRFFSIDFSSEKRNILVEYTPDFPPDKVRLLFDKIDWNHVFQNAEQVNEKKIFHGALNDVDKFDLEIPKEICKVLTAYLYPETAKNVSKNSSKNKE